VVEAEEGSTPRMEFYSHIGQDKWVTEVFRRARGGYFLDFGAFDGITTSNTLFLEKELGWFGICVEPNPRYYADVCRLRNCIKVNCALWTKSRESLEFRDAHGLSSLANFGGNDNHAETRRNAPIIRVDTINPNELLKRFNAPSYIHYMSLDTEGCEFEILEAIQLDEFKIATMTIEHNHEPIKRDKIRHLLANLGYSHAANKNDDFFYHWEHIEHLTGGVPEAFLDPREAADQVIKTYRIKEVVCNY
jgi:FkbM family methyltransferase